MTIMMQQWNVMAGHLRLWAKGVSQQAHQAWDQAVASAATCGSQQGPQSSALYRRYYRRYHRPIICIVSLIALSWCAEQLIKSISWRQGFLFTGLVLSATCLYRFVFILNLDHDNDDDDHDDHNKSRTRLKKEKTHLHGSDDEESNDYEEARKILFGESQSKQDQDPLSSSV